MRTFLRIENHQFYSANEGHNGRIFEVNSKSYSESEYRVAKKASKIIGSQKSCSFVHRGKKWKVVRINENSLFRRICRRIFPFKLKSAEGRYERFKVRRSFFSCGKVEEKDRDVYESQPLNSLYSFRSLAAKANQKHEPIFKNVNQTTQFVIVLNQGDLQLVKKEGADAEMRQAACEAWQEHFIAMHGQRKFDQIIDFYGLDLSEGVTPELVYRMNIGASNIEFADVQDFIQRYRSNQPLTEREQKRLDEVGSAKFERMFRRNSMQAACGLLEFTAKEKELATTGKKIVLPISTTYTVADRDMYQPWVDQQELMQISERLKQCKTEEAYQELLSHVVVKKHLLRVDSQGPRVGAILPAPQFMGGYYVVSGCITNGANMCYTLEDPSEQKQKPAILLFRSTTTDSYAMNWSDTIVNDFNHMNSPGYLGSYTIDPYMRRFIQERTIPVWVGYLEQAKACEDGEEQKLYVAKANEALDSANKLLDLGQILQKHDQLLNMVFFPFMAGDLRSFIKASRKDILADMIEKYVYKNKKEPTEDEREEDIKSLQALAIKIKEQKADLPVVCRQAEELIQDLEKLANFEPAESSTEEDLSLEDLEELAEERRERVEDKQATDLIFCGQSLGGGSAQMAIARYMALDGRMPLPEKKCQGYFFQEPGINRSDVEAFAKYGKKHAEMFKAHDVSYSIYKRHETGDVVTAGGEMGLGAVATLEEEEEELAWLSYDAAVNSRSKQAKPLDLSEMPLHGARWHQDDATPRKGSIKFDGRKITRTKTGEKVRDYTEMEVSPYQEGLYNLGSLGELHGDEKRLYRKLYRDVWQLSSRLEFVFNEASRKSMKLPFMIFRRSLKVGAEAVHKLPVDYVDEHGALAWDLNGRMAPCHET